MTPAPISVERLPAKWRGEKDGSLTPWASNYNGALEACAKDLERALPALLHQLAEGDAECERLRQDYKESCDITRDWIAANNALSARAEAAERAREEACKIIAELRDYVVNERDAQVLPRKAASYQRELDSVDAFLAASGGK